MEINTPAGNIKIVETNDGVNKGVWIEVDGIGLVLVEYDDSKDKNVIRVWNHKDENGDYEYIQEVKNKKNVKTIETTNKNLECPAAFDFAYDNGGVENNGTLDRYTIQFTSEEGDSLLIGSNAIASIWSTSNTRISPEEIERDKEEGNTNIGDPIEWENLPNQLRAILNYYVTVDDYVKEATVVETKKCSNCGHTQEINDKNIHQDISGKFIVCEKCDTFNNVEPKEK